MTAKKATNAIDLYIADFPVETQKLLQQIRETIRKAAPDAEEKIGYGIPTFVLHGNLVHFAGYKHHIGFYPGAAGIAVFSKEMSAYKQSKGAVQFPLNKPLPLALVTKITKFRIKQNEEKAIEKKKEKQPEQKKAFFFDSLVAPARRALENKKIKTLKQLSKFTEAELLELHGMGPSSIPKLRNALKTEGLSFKK
jgi:uncharacterized protein YdhG (YjbR/CyaY superfamily)